MGSNWIAPHTFFIEKIKKEMISVKIKALKDLNLRTTLEERFLVKGEVAIIKFKNDQQVKDFLELDIFVRAKPGEPEGKEIPIIPKPESSGQKTAEKESDGLEGYFRVEDYLTNRVNGRLVEEKN